MVVADLNFFKIEDFGSLLPVCFKVLLHLLPRERSPFLIPTGGVPNHCGKAADQKDHMMSGIRECLEFAKRHCMTEVEFGAREINAEIDPELFSAREFCFRKICRNHFRDCTGEEIIGHYVDCRIFFTS